MFDESPEDAWKLRFGKSAPSDLPHADHFLNHRSVRKYDDRPIPEATIEFLVAAAQSAATSSNLQLWSVVSVQQSDAREKLAKLCGDQQQVRDAAWFFAFLADHYRIRSVAESLAAPTDALDYVELYTMAVIDAALAAERMVCAAESLGIGACYIGGLRNDAQGVAEVLRLPQGVFGTFGLCLGWPDESASAQIKPRLPQGSIWFREVYDRNLNLGDYDERMSAFYEAEKMKGDVTWSMRSARRVGPNQLTGRQVLKGWLEEHGFNRL